MRTPADDRLGETDPRAYEVVDSGEPRLDAEGEALLAAVPPDPQIFDEDENLSESALDANSDLQKSGVQHERHRTRHDR